MASAMFTVFDGCCVSGCRPDRIVCATSGARRQWVDYPLSLAFKQVRTAAARCPRSAGVAHQGAFPNTALLGDGSITLNAAG